MCIRQSAGKCIDKNRQKTGSKYEKNVKNDYENIDN